MKKKKKRNTYTHKNSLLNHFSGLFIIHSTTLVVLVLLVLNTAIVYFIRFKLLAQNCMTPAEVSSDQRCLYIYNDNIFEKGTREEPHQEQACGQDITSIIPETHLADVVFYLDPNLLMSVCSEPVSTPTPPPPTPTPTPAPTAPPPTSTPPASQPPKNTSTPKPIATAVPQVSVKPTARPSLLPTPTPILDLDPVRSKLGGLTKMSLAELEKLPKASARPTPTPQPSGINQVIEEVGGSLKGKVAEVDADQLTSKLSEYFSIIFFTKLLGYLGVLSIFVTLIVALVGFTPLKYRFENWFYEK